MLNQKNLHLHYNTEALGLGINSTKTSAISTIKGVHLQSIETNRKRYYLFWENYVVVTLFDEICERGESWYISLLRANQRE